VLVRSARFWIVVVVSPRERGSITGGILAGFFNIHSLRHPWTLRNYRTFGSSFSSGQPSGANCAWATARAPTGTWIEFASTQDTFAMRQYISLGEFGYIENRRRQALDYIKAIYPRFAVLCLKRFQSILAGPPRLANIGGWPR